jgi:hypothetical protein
VTSVRSEHASGRVESVRLTINGNGNPGEVTTVARGRRIGRASGMRAPTSRAWSG